MRRPFVADIGDGDGENRRQHQPLHERQNTSADSVGAKAAISVGSVSTSMAVTITRLRPSTSATVPVNGAVNATASVLAVRMVEISAGPAPNCSDSSGRIACGEYRLMKAAIAGEPDRQLARAELRTLRGVHRDPGLRRIS